MKRIILLLALLICQSLSAQKEYKDLVRFHVPIGATEDVAKNIIRNHNYSISHTKDDNGVHYVYYKDNYNMSITKYFVAIGMKNGKVESVKWFLESDSYDRIITDKNAIFTYFQEDLKYRTKEYGGEYYYTNFNYYGQTVGLVMYTQASYYNGGFVRLTFYSNKTVVNMVNEKKYDELIDEARALYWKKRYDEARRKYDEAFALFPNRKADHLQLYTESLYGGETKAFNALINDAEELRKKKKYDEAKKKYDLAFNIFPEKKHMYQIMYQKEYIECGGKIDMDESTIFNALISLARDFSQPGRYAEAKEKYDEAFKMAPDKKVSYQKEYDECVDMSKEENADYINEFYKLITEAGFFLKQKKYNQAKIQFDEAFEMFPNKKVSYQKEYEECFNMSIKENVEFYTIINEAGNLRKQKKYDEAKKKYDEAFEIIPDKKNSYQKEYGECVNKIENAEKYDRLISDAGDLRKQKNYYEAKKKYDEAFKLFPDRKVSYQKEYEECVNMSKEENAEYINRFYTLISDAGDLRKQKKYDEAKKKYDEAFEIFPDKKSLYQKEYDECVTGTRTKEQVNPNSQNQEKQAYLDSQDEEKRQQERLQLLKQKSQEIEKQYASFYAEFEKELSESEDILERDPAFPGGLETLSKYIADNIEYPPQAKDAKVTGRVYVSFIVEKDGTISIVDCLRDIGYGCCDEAVMLVKSMPRWNPGIQKGKPVRTQFNLPITFDLH